MLLYTYNNELTKEKQLHVNVRILSVQKYGGSKIRQYAKTSTVGYAETGYERTTGSSCAYHQGYDPSTTTCARRHGDG